MKLPIFVLIIKLSHCFPYEETCSENTIDESDLDWKFIEKEALEKLGEIHFLLQNSKDKVIKSSNDVHDVVKRDSGYHDDDNIVVRCKHSYTGNIQ